MYVRAYVVYKRAWAAYKHVLLLSFQDSVDPVHPTSVHLVHCWAQVIIMQELLRELLLDCFVGTSMNEVAGVCL